MFSFSDQNEICAIKLRIFNDFRSICDQVLAVILLKRVFEKEKGMALTMKSRFLFITHQMDRSGAPTSLLNIMEEFREQGYGEVDVIAMRGGTQIDEFRRLSDKLYIVSHKKNTNYIENCLLFFRLIFFFWQTRGIESVLINSSINLRAMILSVIFRKRSFLYVRESENMHRSKLAFMRIRLMAKMTGLISVSQHTAEWLTKYVDGAKIEVIHNGIKVLSDQALTRSTDSKAGYKWVAIIGNLDIRKGIDRFYEIAKAVLAERKDIGFIVVGNIVDEDLKNKITGLSEQFTGRIEFTGEVDNVHPYILKCAAVLMLSREEALPRVVMEASSNAVPVLAIDVAGTREMLPKNYEYIFPNFDVFVFKDALIHLVNSNMNVDIGFKNHAFCLKKFDRRKTARRTFLKLIK